MPISSPSWRRSISALRNLPSRESAASARAASFRPATASRWPHALWIYDAGHLEQDAPDVVQSAAEEVRRRPTPRRVQQTARPTRSDGPGSPTRAVSQRASRVNPDAAALGHRDADAPPDKWIVVGHALVRAEDHRAKRAVVPNLVDRIRALPIQHPRHGLVALEAAEDQPSKSLPGFIRAGTSFTSTNNVNR